MRRLLRATALAATAILLGLHYPARPFAAESGTVIVTQPASNIRIAEGEDYATWEIGNRWDMDCPDWSGVAGQPPDDVWDPRFTCDVDQTESRDIASEAFANGIYSGTAMSDNPWFWLAYPGRFSTIRLARGSLYPIDTSKYRYFSAKVRYTGSTIDQRFNLVFFNDHEGSSFGTTRAFTPWIAAGTWTIVSFDLWDDATYFEGTTKWTDLSPVRGLRVNVTHDAAVDFEIDWARLTMDPSLPGTPDSTALVEWSANGTGSETFSIDAIDTGGTAVELVQGLPVGTTSSLVDLSILPPGAYAVRVRASGGASDTSPGQVLVNEAPILHFLEPDKQGDTARAYSKVEACPTPGDPSSCYDWSDFDAGDIYFIQNFSITNSEPLQPPVEAENAAKCAQLPTCPDPNCVGDPWFPLMTCLERNFAITAPDDCFQDRFAQIDTNRYRMFSYRFEVVGSRSCGSIARAFWGTSLSALEASDDIDVKEGLNTYVLGDLNNLWLATSNNNGPTDNWSGGANPEFLKYFRFDPHELWDARTFRLHSFVLAPVDSANASGNFDITWLDSDTDDDASIDLYYDVDNIPGNGNETLIAAGLSENDLDDYTWNTTSPAEVEPGEYLLYAIVSDSINSVVRYATGPLRVPGIRVSFSIIDGISLDWTDTVPDETEYRIERRLVGESTYQQIAVLPADTTDYTDRTAAGGKAYEYRVLACNGSGCSVTLTYGPVLIPAMKFFVSDDSES